MLRYGDRGVLEKKEAVGPPSSLLIFLLHCGPKLLTLSHLNPIPLPHCLAPIPHRALDLGQFVLFKVPSKQKSTGQKWCYLMIQNLDLIPDLIVVLTFARNIKS